MRNHYGLKSDHNQSRTELLDDEGYFLAWTWGEHEGRVTWVNWFVMTAFRWCRRDSGQRHSLMHHEASSSPPLGDDELTLDRWRDAEFLAHGFVKWDGCAQWECDVHLDSRDERQVFFETVHLAHQRAAEIMGDAFDGRAEEA